MVCLGVIREVNRGLLRRVLVILRREPTDKYRQSNRIGAPAVNPQFDATAGATLGIFILGSMPLASVGVESIDYSFAWSNHRWLILLALSCQVIGWIAITYALPRLPAAHTSFAVLLQPVLTIVWGVILLDESPSLQQSAGMTLIFVAIIAVTLFGSATTDDEA